MMREKYELKFHDCCVRMQRRNQHCSTEERVWARRDKRAGAGRRLRSERTKVLTILDSCTNNRTGTDGCRVLCHQFSPSSLPLLVHCISRCNSCSPTIKPMTPVLLRLLVNGDQGQDSRTTLFLLNTGQRSSIAWWRTTNHFVKWQMSMVSRMKRSVASYFVSRSSVGAAPDDGGEFGHLSQRLDRALDFAYPCLIPEHSMLPISGSEDPYGLSDRLVPAHVLPHHFSGTA